MLESVIKSLGVTFYRLLSPHCFISVLAYSPCCKHFNSETKLSDKKLSKHFQEKWFQFMQRMPATDFKV